MELKPLSEVFTSIKNGLNVEQTDNVGNYRVSRIQSISSGTFNILKTKWTKENVQEVNFLNDGDILLSHINSYEHLAKSALYKDAGEKIVHGANLIRLIPNRNEIIPSYASYVLKSKYFITCAKLFAQRAVNQASIKISDLKTIKIPVPPLSIQQQIVDELEDYQRIIDGARAIAESYKPIIPRNIAGEQKTLDEVVEFRPSKNETKNLSDDTVVSFVPMADMNANNISFIPKETKTLKEVYSGFTYFQNNDVLLAKITPCFENGKSGLARNLKNGIGFGSTEYIVMRAKQDVVLPEWIYYHINSTDFITNGKCYMTGTAGQQRIDINYVKNYIIKVPSVEQQQKIIAQIETEQKLIDPSRQIIEVFKKKIEDRINELFQ